MCVIPLKHGKPIIKWAKYYELDYRPDTELLNQWDSIKKPELALLCGKESGVTTIDIDIEDEKKIKVLEKVLGTPASGKIGSKGATFFFKYNGEAYETFKKDGKIIVEVLSDKHLTTLPPSKHRDKEGVIYKWTGKPLCEAELTNLPANYADLIRNIFLIPVQQKDEYEFTRNYKYNYEKTPEFDEAEKLIYDYCSPDCSREDWIILGSALKSSFGDAAYGLFDEWSSRSSKYDKKSIRSVWRSLSANINYGAIVNIAKQGGFRPVAQKHIPIKTIKVEDWDKKKLEIIAETIKESQELPEFYKNAPEHVKMICDWILETSFYPQPIITLGATLSFLSFVMGTNAELGGLKPNLYTILLSGTGTGKEHIIRCIWGMASEINLKQKISSAWSSDTAIIKRLKKNEGTTFYLTDEMYQVMQSLSKGNSNSREAAAAGALLKAYTGVKIETIDYADEKERPTEIVENPFVSIAGFSTPEPFFDAIGQKEAFSGFVGRLAVFEGSFLLPEPNLKHDGTAWKTIPPKIKEILKEIHNNVDRLSHKGKSITSTKVITLGEGVQEAIEKMQTDIRNKRNEFKIENNPMDNVIARMGELVLKYAIIASKGNQIQINHLIWAKSLAEYNLGIICAASSQFTDSKFDNKVAKLFNWIEKQGGVADKTKLNNYCKVFDNRREREEAIQELIEREKIEIVKLEGLGQKKAGYKIKTP